MLRCIVTWCYKYSHSTSHMMDQQSHWMTKHQKVSYTDQQLTKVLRIMHHLIQHILLESGNSVG